MGVREWKQTPKNQFLKILLFHIQIPRVRKRLPCLAVLDMQCQLACPKGNIHCVQIARDKSSSPTAQCNLVKLVERPPPKQVNLVLGKVSCSDKWFSSVHSEMVSKSLGKSTSASSNFSYVVFEPDLMSGWQWACLMCNTGTGFSHDNLPQKTVF